MRLWGVDSMTSARRHFGSVRRLPSGQWQASYWHDGLRHIAPRTFDQKADAHVFLDATSASIHRGDWVNPEFGRVAFSEYAELWLAQRTDIRPRTREYYGWLIKKRLAPHFGSRELSKITPMHVRAWYAGLAQETPGVAHSAYRVLRAIFNAAIQDDLIIKNPCRVKGGGTDKSAERKVPTVAQVAALTEAMPEQYRAAVIFAAWGTLRRGEVLGLQRRDIDLLSGSVRIERALHEYHDGSLELGPTKNGEPRRVHLPRNVMSIVEDHLQCFVGPAEDAPMFVGSTGEPLRPSGLWNIWEQARRKAGLETVRFHDLRHFAATMFASTGASTKEIMSRGGWKSVTMVVRYEHASDERDALLAEALNPFTQSGIVVPLGPLSTGDRARSAHDGAEASDEIGEVEDSPALNRDFVGGSSEGETRTLNLAVNSRLLCH